LRSEFIYFTAVKSPLGDLGVELMKKYGTI